MGYEDSIGVEVDADASGAVTGLDGLADAVDRFNVRMGAMSETMARPLESVGVHMFGRELLQTLGIANEGRPVLMLLRAGVTELTGAMGIGAGEAAMYTFGLTALAAIAYKVYEAHNDEAESIKKVAAENEAEVKGSEEMIARLTEYYGIVGKLPPELEKLLAAEKTLFAFKNAEEIATIEKEIATNEESREKLLQKKNEYAGLNVITQAHSKFTDEDAEQVKKLAAVDDALAVKLTYLKEGYGNLGEAIKKKTEADKGAIENLAELNKADQADIIGLQGDEAEFQKWVDKRNAGYLKAAAAYETSMASMRTSQTQQKIEIAKHFDEMADKERAWWGLSKSGTEDMSHYASGQFQNMASSFGNVAGKMMVEGQNFKTATAGLIRELAVQAIDQFAAMGVKYAAMQAYEAYTHRSAQSAITAQQTAATAAQVAVVGAGSTAMVTSLNAVADAQALAYGGPYAGPAMEAEMNLAFAPLYTMAVPKPVGLALGGDFLVDKPTYIQVGEGGQTERVTVTPSSTGGGTSGGGAGSGDVYNFTFGDIVVQGVQNPREFAEQVALLTIQRIRGRGDLSMIGRSIH